MANFPDCAVRWLTYGNPKTVRKLGEQGNKAVLGWVMKEGLIPSRYECQKCKEDMLLVERKGKIDGFEWRCRVQSKENPHFVCRSVRKGMWFSHSRLSICVILRLTREMARYRVSSARRVLHLFKSDALARKDTLWPWVSLAMSVATPGREIYVSPLQGTHPIENILEIVMSPRKMGELERSIALDQFSHFLGLL
ncbi:uncharacterized protein TNCV_1448241 [Trichonephila clavipes]|nr:uncharacterized protein TNCV_1448241 [Trichonephila clavipes]